MLIRWGGLNRNIRVPIRFFVLRSQQLLSEEVKIDMSSQDIGPATWPILSVNRRLLATILHFSTDKLHSKTSSLTLPS